MSLPHVCLLLNVQGCIRTSSRSLHRGAASICRPIPASGRDRIMHPGLKPQLISMGRCSRARCFVLLCGRRSMPRLRWRSMSYQRGGLRRRWLPKFWLVLSIPLETYAPLQSAVQYGNHFMLLVWRISF